MNMKKWIVPAAALLCLALPSDDAQAQVSIEDFDPFVSQLQMLVEAADRDGFLQLLTPGTDPEAARDFARDAFRENVDRAVVRPMFLIPAEEDGGTNELTVEVFTEMGDRARLQTWRLELASSSSTRSTTDDTPRAASGEGSWTVADYESLGGVESLHHLKLTPDKQFDATNLAIAGEDMTLRVSRGAVFVVEVDNGITGLVLVGDGVITFDPAPDAERRQLQIFSARETLEAEFTHAFVRVNPEMFASRVSPAMLQETRLDSGDLGEAQELFDQVATQSYTVNLSDVSDRTWWLNPSPGHFTVEVSTRRYGVLTYVEDQNQPEDIMLYQREPEYKLLSRYSSARQRAVQGQYYADEDSVPFDVLDYDIVASFEPAGVRQESLQARAELEGCWIDGTTRLAVRVSGVSISNLILQLAEDLRVRSVTSRELGPLLFFRLGRGDLVVNLPNPVVSGTEFGIIVSYTGLLQAQEPEENWIGRARQRFAKQTPLFGIGEERYIYSGATAWYPQSPIHDFATATMDLTVPADYGVIASGAAEEGNPVLSPLGQETGVKSFRFTALQPAKYLSALISRFWPHEMPMRDIALEMSEGKLQIRSGVVYEHVGFSVETNPRSAEKLGDYEERASAILAFYGSLVGDIPYPALTLALTDSALPGGHSPAYFVMINQLLPLNPGEVWSWGDDPAAFSDREHFFLAHELAHQWWGQAVGWKNYHEQWLSEGLAQYFAALYTQAESGNDAFHDVLAQMRRWAERHSDQGPVYLGYRLGHIDGDSRVYRSLAYNKGAMVLHMLRLLIGDDVFFDGLRRYYSAMRFKNAGTDDLIRAFEIEAGRSLDDFFERWIHESELPELRFDYRTEARLSGQRSDTDVVLRFEQVGPVFDVPVTVTLRYQSGEEESTVVPITEQLTEIRLPLRDRLRDVKVDENDGMLGKIRR